MSKTIPDSAKPDQPQGNQSPAVAAPIDTLAGQVADLTKLVADCVTADALSAVHKRIDDLANDVAALRKSLTATSKAVATIARDPKDKPRTLSEAIQSVKADGCTLDGQALRNHAIRTHPHIAPEHAKKLAAQDAATKAATKAPKA